MQLDITNLILALCINELIHVASEAWAANDKLARLLSYITKKPYKEIPIKVNTRPKSYAFSIGLFIIIVPIIYFGLGLLSLSASTALKLSALVLVVAYVVGFVWMDKWHVNIEKITNRFK